MKTVLLVWGKLRDFFKHHRLVFLLMCLGVLVTDFMFVFFYGNIKHYYLHANTKNYAVYAADGFMNSDILEKSEYRKWFLDVDYYITLDKNVLSQNTNDFFNFAKYLDNKQNIVIRVRANFDEMGSVKGHVKNLSLPYSIAIPQSLDMVQNSFSHIFLNGKTVQVVATTVADIFWMGYDTMLLLDMQPNGATVQLDSRMNAKQEQDFCRYLQNKGLLVEKQEIEYDKSNLKSSIATLCVVYVTSMFTLIYIMIYLTESYSYELNIYKLCGASTKKITNLMGLVLDFILFGLGLLSSLLHRVTYRTVLKDINLFETITYEFTDYLLILIATLLLSHTVISVYLRMKVGKSIIANSRHLQN